MIVTVGDQPAACHNMTCGYTYSDAKGEVTAISYDKTTKKLVIEGTDLP